MPIKLSVVIITLNEERNIGRCLASVMSIADEIVVIDSFSTDSTEAICASFNVRFIQRAFTGYVDQKNFADSQASNDYIFSIDADEEITQELSQEILKLKSDFRLAGYFLNRLTNYCGAWIKHGGWYPDKKLRLYNRSKGAWHGLSLHEQYQVAPGKITGSLKSDLLHYSYYSISDHLKQIDHFTSIAVEELRVKSIKPNFWHLTAKPPIKFIEMYIIKAGFLDGFAGFTIAILSSFATFIKYAKWFFSKK